MPRIHFTEIGMTCAPREADRDGFLEFREGFMDNLPRKDWTPAEDLIRRCRARIESARKNEEAWAEGISASFEGA